MAASRRSTTTDQLPAVRSDSLRVEIPPAFREFADAALVRLRYLYPTTHFLSCGTEIIAQPGAGVDTSELTRDINYLLYRERIYRETVPLRRMLFDKIFSK